MTITRDEFISRITLLAKQIEKKRCIQLLLDYVNQYKPHMTYEEAVHLIQLYWGTEIWNPTIDKSLDKLCGIDTDKLMEALTERYKEVVIPYYNKEEEEIETPNDALPQVRQCKVSILNALGRIHEIVVTVVLIHSDEYNQLSYWSQSEILYAQRNGLQHEYGLRTLRDMENNICQFISHYDTIPRENDIFTIGMYTYRAEKITFNVHLNQLIVYLKYFKVNTDNTRYYERNTSPKSPK